MILTVGKLCHPILKALFNIYFVAYLLLQHFQAFRISIKDGGLSSGLGTIWRHWWRFGSQLVTYNDLQVTYKWPFNRYIYPQSKGMSLMRWSRPYEPFWNSAILPTEMFITHRASMNWRQPFKVTITIAKSSWKLELGPGSISPLSAHSHPLC